MNAFICFSSLPPFSPASSSFVVFRACGALDATKSAVSELQKEVAAVETGIDAVAWAIAAALGYFFGG